MVVVVGIVVVWGIVVVVVSHEFQLMHIPLNNCLHVGLQVDGWVVVVVWIVVVVAPDCWVVVVSGTVVVVVSQILFHTYILVLFSFCFQLIIKIMYQNLL